MRNDIFCIESLMLAEQEMCDQFTTTVAIFDKSFEAVFTGQFNPRPLGPTQFPVPMLMIHKKSLAEAFRTNEEDEFVFGIELKVSEKRTIEEFNEDYEDEED